MNAVFFLLLVVAVAAVGCTGLYLRHRSPRSVEAGIDTFRREMAALGSRSDDPPRRRRWKR